MEYLHWDETTIADFSEANIAAQYERGYVFTRIGKGVMHQTRSVRVDLAKFELSSENRRILKKAAEANIALSTKPLPLADYHWSLGKLAKDFYEAKFGPGIMSAVKIKEILTDAAAGNFNSLLAYSTGAENSASAAYCIAYENSAMLHYSYPFYDLAAASKNMGMGMMLTAIEYAKKSGKRFIYLGSLQRPGDIYKLQFAGLEWFDGKMWQTDLEKAKMILNGK
ncbi:MAG: Arginine-tRNA-protein transferase domain protein [Candidatus Taylorbacteria bacterium]|nr:Arginine-tRNA-protein transferase domain protein [Candidatus Taylorbacteria bacterium]